MVFYGIFGIIMLIVPFIGKEYYENYADLFGVFVTSLTINLIGWIMLGVTTNIAHTTFTGFSIYDPIAFIVGINSLLFLWMLAPLYRCYATFEM